LNREERARTAGTAAVQAIMTSTISGAPPTEATNAVLVQSEEMPQGSQKVEELDFNKLKGPITADDLLQGMKHMGFQASSMCEAVRIINEMVSKEM
jgi:deoxyhypusine synthase